jgi:hypothetical protein
LTALRLKAGQAMGRHMKVGLAAWGRGWDLEWSGDMQKKLMHVTVLFIVRLAS